MKIRKDKNEKAKAYVTNAQIMDAWYDAKKKGKLTNELARCLVLIAERYSYHPWFSGYSFREDMVCHAVVNLCANWHKFKPEYAIEKGQSPNPFAYFTTSCYRSFLSYLAEEKKERDIRDQLLAEAGMNPSFNFQFTVNSSDDTAFMSNKQD